MQSQSGSGPVSGVLGLFRLGNCAMAALGALLAAIVCVGVDGLEEHSVAVPLSMAVVVLFTAAGNSLNDYYDRETDKVAHPRRPIPSGSVRPSQALGLSVALFTCAQVLSFLVNEWAVAIVAASILVMIGYEKLLKAEGFAGNLAISWLTGALFLFGGAAVERLDLAWILAALAFLATLGREIVKDVQDIEGDRGARHTLPMRIGAKRAGVLASASFGLAVCLSPVPYALELLSWPYVPVVVLADAIFIYCALIHFRNPEKGQKMAKLAMLVALLAFLFGGVF
ncbi:MAG: UbiA family prenyltransferase [Candidatus Thermoplasmatota archaeon]|nr:UbiA family prenyltransferase [Candidatus Thermoplasmatota archaeon]